MTELRAKPGPIELDPARTAVIIVDMQNAFASKGGMFDLAGLDISGAAGAVEATGRLVTAAREAGVPVVYLQMTYSPDLKDGGDAESPNFQKELGLVMMRQRPELAGKLLVRGTWDWQIVDTLGPLAGELVVEKPRYDGFTRTRLAEKLRGLGVRDLLFTGIATTSASRARRGMHSSRNSGPSWLKTRSIILALTSTGKRPHGRLRTYSGG